MAGSPRYFRARRPSRCAIAAAISSLDSAPPVSRSATHRLARSIQKTPANTRLFPVVSHDGRNVAFFWPSDHGSILRVVPSDGGTPRDLWTVSSPVEAGGSWAVTWSPDDRYIYFVQRSAVSRVSELFRLPAGGGTPDSASLKGEEMNNIDIAPDGSRIAFSQGILDRQEIWTLENHLPAAKK
jgi:Tol biopolymer transport system component